MNAMEKIKSLAAKEKKPESNNPYVNGRRKWNEHIALPMTTAFTWQIVGLLSLLIALTAVGGMVYVGSQSKFVPYVVQVDKVGQAVAVGRADQSPGVSQQIRHAFVARFINDARMVTPDVALQKKAIFRVYSMLSQNDPASGKMRSWYSSGEDSSPFKRASRETVEVDITSVLPQTKDTWQVDWIETVRDRQGNLKKQPYRMRALVTLYVSAPSASTPEEEMRQNPLGVYVKDFSWTKQI